MLLQNNADRLPLKAGAKIAVIGADADDLGVLQGNYHGTAIRPVTPLDGIRARFGAANVRYAQGSALADGAAVVVPETALRSGGKPGLRADYSGPASVTRQDRRIDLDFNRAPAAPGLPIGPFKANWTGEFVPPGPGQYRLIIDQSQCWKDCTTHDSARVTLGGKVLHDGPLPKGRVEMTVDSDGTPQPIAITLDHVSDDESFRLLWMPPAQPLLDQAVAAVRDADVAIVVAGLSPDLEGEALSVSVPGFVGGDRTDIALPLPQQRLLAALKATGKPIVLVLSSGSAVSVDPTSADAILANWYPGEAGGTRARRRAVGRHQPRWPPARHLLPRHHGSARLHRLRDEGAHLSLLHRHALVGLRPRPQLYAFRLCRAARRRQRRRRPTAHGADYRHQHRRPRRRRGGAGLSRPPPPPPARSAARRRRCNASSSATAA